MILSYTIFYNIQMIDTVEWSLIIWIELAL